jgi:hypothetical protein
MLHPTPHQQARLIVAVSAFCELLWLTLLVFVWWQVCRKP